MGMPGAAGNLAAGKFLMQFIVQSENMELPRSFCLQKANNSSGSRKSGSVPEIAEPVWCMLCCVFSFVEDAIECQDTTRFQAMVTWT